MQYYCYFNYKKENADINGKCMFNSRNEHSVRVHSFHTVQ